MQTYASRAGDWRKRGHDMRLVCCALTLALLGCAGLSSANLLSAGTLGARIVLKGPVDQKCSESGLRECSSITEGMLLYVEGKPVEGKEYLRVGTIANSPEALKAYAKAISALGTIPGASPYMGPVLDAARFLDMAEGQPAGMPASFQAEVQLQHSGQTESPPNIENHADRVIGGMKVPLQSPVAVKCGAGGVTALCVRAESGPVLLTALNMVGLCNDRAFAMAAESDGDLGAPRWAIAVTAGQPNFAGGKYLVRSGETLFVGLQSPPSSRTSSQCAVTWAGYRVVSLTEPAPTAPLVATSTRTAGPTSAQSEARAPATTTSSASTTETEAIMGGGPPSSLSELPAPSSDTNGALPAVFHAGTSGGSSGQAEDSRHGLLPLTPTESHERPRDSKASPHSSRDRFTVALGAAYSSWTYPGASSVFSNLTLSFEARLFSTESAFNLVVAYSALGTLPNDTPLTTGGALLQNSFLLAPEYSFEGAPLRLGVGAGAGFKLGPRGPPKYQDSTEFGIVLQPYADWLFADHFGLRASYMGALMSNSTSVWSLGLGLLINL